MIWRGVRVSQLRCALYGLPIYREGDRAGVFNYGFYRNKVVLLPKAQEPAYCDIHELKGPVVIYVDVLHLTDEAAPGVEDAPLAEFALRGTRVLGVRQPAELHGASLDSGGKGALLTALANSAVRSHQTVLGRPVYRYPYRESGRRDPSPGCQVYRSNRSNAKRRLCTGVRGRQAFSE